MVGLTDQHHKTILSFSYHTKYIHGLLTSMNLFQQWYYKLTSNKPRRPYEKILKNNMVFVIDSSLDCTEAQNTMRLFEI